MNSISVYMFVSDIDSHMDTIKHHNNQQSVSNQIIKLPFFSERTKFFLSNQVSMYKFVFCVYNSIMPSLLCGATPYFFL